MRSKIAIIFPLTNHSHITLSHKAFYNTHNLIIHFSLELSRAVNNIWRQVAWRTRSVPMKDLVNQNFSEDEGDVVLILKSTMCTSMWFYYKDTVLDRLPAASVCIPRCKCILRLVWWTVSVEITSTSMYVCRVLCWIYAHKKCLHLYCMSYMLTKMGAILTTRELQRTKTGYFWFFIVCAVFWFSGSALHNFISSVIVDINIIYMQTPSHEDWHLRCEVRPIGGTNSYHSKCQQ